MARAHPLLTPGPHAARISVWAPPTGEDAWGGKTDDVQSPVVSPDDKLTACQSGAIPARRIYIIDPASNQSTIVTRGPGFYTRPCRVDPFAAAVEMIAGL